MNITKKIAGISNKAVRNYMEANVPPSDTITEEFSKLSGYNKEHVNRAAQKTNVELVQKIALHNKDDRGIRFPVADSDAIMGALNIKEKTAMFTQEFGNQLMQQGKLGTVQAEAPANHFSKLASCSKAHGKKEKESKEVYPIVKKDKKKTEKDAKFASMMYASAFDKLSEALGEGFITRGKNINKLAWAVNKEFGDNATVLFLKSAKEVGIEGFDHTESSLLPDNYMPSTLRAKMAALTKAVDAMADCLKVGHFKVASTQAIEDIEVDTIGQRHTEGKFAGLSIGMDKKGYFLTNCEDRTHSFDDLSYIHEDAITSLRGEK